MDERFAMVHYCYRSFDRTFGPLKLETAMSAAKEYSRKEGVTMVKVLELTVAKVIDIPCGGSNGVA